VHHGGAGIGRIGVAVDEPPVVAGNVHQRPVGDHIGVDGHRAVGQPSAAGALGRGRSRVPGGALAAVDGSHALDGGAVLDLGADKLRDGGLLAIDLDDGGHHGDLGDAVDLLRFGPFAVEVDFAVGHSVQAVAALLQ